ncbi:putative Atlastin-1 [Hypsibius exemplaris]|uniref:Atlastin-1 n=1 Tax=Hypsibius exemplaris TaxID=2072580 RepID=A0A1W0WBZ7_HYPEX|nr:putative Atlastin-1 [Hypsibius exemplaris]
MSQPLGYPVEIVHYNNEEGFIFDETALGEILKDPTVAGKEVMVVAAAGAFPVGKSFLLSLLIRMLDAVREGTKTWEDLANGLWTNDDTGPLRGFHWTDGDEMVTGGLYFWSQPCQVELQDGREVAILFVDCQGSPDVKLQLSVESTLFAISAAISSVQIYNLPGRISSTDLNYLKMFSHHGCKTFDAENAEHKPFQKLLFLIRDCPFIEDYGMYGGKAYLDTTLNGNHNPISAFEMADCFLMPRPGLNVDGRNMDEISDIDDSFLESAARLAYLLFSPLNAQRKRIAGQFVTGTELFGYAKDYVRYLISAQPELRSISDANAFCQNKQAEEEAFNNYKTAMHEVISTAMILDLDSLDKHHGAAFEMALKIFRNPTKMRLRPPTDDQKTQFIDKIDSYYRQLKMQIDFIRNETNQRLNNIPEDEQLDLAYDYLGVNMTATNEEIRRRYREKAELSHPDKGGNYKDFITLRMHMVVIEKARSGPRLSKNRCVYL